MVTRRHRLAELLAHLHALHLASGEHMLLIAPEFPLEGAPGPAETSRALAEGSFVDRSGTRVNLNAEVQRFQSDVESLVIGMASELGLARARLPGVVFLSSPVGPERFVYWELPDEGTIDALVDGIHEITDAIASADRGEQGMFDAIIETKPGEATYESINF